MKTLKIVELNQTVKRCNKKVPKVVQTFVVQCNELAQKCIAVKLCYVLLPLHFLGLWAA